VTDLKGTENLATPTGIRSPDLPTRTYCAIPGSLHTTGWGISTLPPFEIAKHEE